MSISKSVLSVSAALVAVGFASAETMDRPQGVKIGQRMTLRPYVSASVSYDSNAGSSSSSNNGDALWTVSPGLGLDYTAESWSLLLSLYYNYRSYTKSENVRRFNQHSYGETLRWNWSNSRGGEKGWSVMLSETLRKVTMADDLTYADGSSYTADRMQFDVNGGLQRRFNEYWHGDIHAGYYRLDYDNDTSTDRISNYGWSRWNIGAEGGFAPTRWTDIIIALGYHGYAQDNTDNTEYDGYSQGYSLQGGLGSYMTERISYRALAGWSRFEYADGESSSDGFVYTLSGNWKIGDTWNTMLMASSYYQPSERQKSSKTRVDSLGWGLGKSLVRGKLRATIDVTYRHETIESINSNYSDYDLDIATGRLGLHYTLNRFLGCFVTAEYQRSWNSDSGRATSYGDYDRWRLTAGLRLTY